MNNPVLSSKIPLFSSTGSTTPKKRLAKRHDTASITKHKVEVTSWSEVKKSKSFFLLENHPILRTSLGGIRDLSCLQYSASGNLSTLDYAPFTTLVLPLIEPARYRNNSRKLGGELVNRFRKICRYYTAATQYSLLSSAKCRTLQRRGRRPRHSCKVHRTQSSQLVGISWQQVPDIKLPRTIVSNWSTPQKCRDLPLIARHKFCKTLDSQPAG